MPVSDEQDLVAQLRKLGYRIQPPAPLLKLPRCSFCGAIGENALRATHQYDWEGIDPLVDDIDVAEWLTKIKVEINDSSDEGWDYKVLLLCPNHDTDIVAGVKKLGFTTHHHGSTHPLADDENCAYGCDKQGSPYDE